MNKQDHLPGSRIGLLLLLTALLTGCADSSPADPPQAEDAPTGSGMEERPVESGSWTNYRGDPGLRGIASGSLPEKPELRWTFAAEGAIVSSPVVEKNRVYFGSDDGKLYCLDFTTGEELWHHDTTFIIEAPPLLHDGMVYVGSNDFFFYAFDALTGELKWKYETYEKIAGSANVLPGVEIDGTTRDLIVIGSHDAFVYALDAKTGEKHWEYETLDRVNGTPAIDGDAIVFGGCDTILYVLDGATGELAQSIELGGECHIAASVGIDGSDVFLGHHANEFICIDLETETIRWKYPNARFGFFSPPAITADRVVFGGRDKQMHCLDRATGEGIWTYPTRRKIDAAPVICDDKVVFGSGDGRLYLLGLEDGAELWTYDVGDSIFSSPAVVDGAILVGANDGVLYVFGPSPDESEQES